MSLVTIGVIQYISPTLQLVVAVLVYGEPFQAKHQISFGLIWLGLGVYVADAIRVAARQRGGAGARAGAGADRRRGAADGLAVGAAGARINATGREWVTQQSPRSPAASR